MHRSRLAGLIIDCAGDDLAAAAEFWAGALGAPAKRLADLAKSPYVELRMPAGEPYVEVQKVAHASRVHIDIESDDIEAEVARLETLGAKRIADIRDFVVLEAPTGQRFCVVSVIRADFERYANEWHE
jgi:predicted enzyme related to lactoylglutathione lyase